MLLGASTRPFRDRLLDRDVFAETRAAVATSPASMSVQ